MQEIQVRSLGQEEPLEKGRATHFSILAWGIQWTEELGRLQSNGSQRVGHDWATNTQRHTISLSSVQFSSVAQSCLTLQDSMDCSMSGFPVHHQLLELAQTHVHWAGDAIQPSHPLSPPSLLPSIFPSIRVFSNESVLHIRWPKYLSHILWNKYEFFLLCKLTLILPSNFWGG